MGLSACFGEQSVHEAPLTHLTATAVTVAVTVAVEGLNAPAWRGNPNQHDTDVAVSG